MKHIDIDHYKHIITYEDDAGVLQNFDYSHLVHYSPDVIGVAFESIREKGRWEVSINGEYAYISNGCTTIELNEKAVVITRKLLFDYVVIVDKSGVDYFINRFDYVYLWLRRLVKGHILHQEKQLSNHIYWYWFFI